MRQLATVLATLTLSAAAVACTVRDRRPDGPYRLAEEFVDALSDEAVDCAGEHAPSGAGQVVVAAEFTAHGMAPIIHDAGSMPGSEALLECVRQRARDKLRSPPNTPAPFAQVRLPMPLVTSEVTYAFVQQLPAK